MLNHNKRNNRIFEATKDIKAANLDFDVVVCSGLSGVLVAPQIAEALGKDIMIVRKGETSHGKPIEKDYDTLAHRYLIIDDFVETGETIDRIRRELSEFANYSKCVGVYFYTQIFEGAYYTFKEMNENENMWIGANVIS